MASYRIVTLARDRYISEAEVRTGLVRQILRVTSLVLVILIAVGCAPARGEEVSSRIRAANSPVVREVTFYDDWFDGTQVLVHLQPGVTEAQAQRLWCEVIAPAGGIDGPTGSTDDGKTYVTVLDANDEWVSAPTACPASSPSPRG